MRDRVPASARGSAADRNTSTATQAGPLVLGSDRTLVSRSLSLEGSDHFLESIENVLLHGLCCQANVANLQALLNSSHVVAQRLENLQKRNCRPFRLQHLDGFRR